MRICIFGAGVIGGILAGACARAGHDVSLVARGPHLAAIKTNGLTVITPDRSETFALSASDNPADLGVQDFVIVCTKTPALPEVAAAIGPLLGPNTMVAFSVNGIFWFYGDGFAPGREALDMTRLDPDGALHRAVGAERAMGLIAWAGGEIREPGIIHARADGKFALGHALPEKAAVAEELVASLAIKDWEFGFVPEVRVPMWTKFMSIAGNFATSTLTGGTIAQVQANPETLEVSLSLQGEANALARAHGFTQIPFDPDKIRQNPSKIQHKPSMLQDIERGRAMEIASAYLITQDLARQAGVPTPVHDVIVPMLTLRAKLAGCFDG
ncbi:MAG: 2-dehydropantoate 2-reductase [Beijerinckiaceae bacterium]|jgi:2-dehydropantoate 2-reductase|nr:2-dehydropantoate 2-reductase [Beijerinckiaceae bacterium]